MKRALKIVALVAGFALVFAIGWAWPILVRLPLVVGQDAITDAASAQVEVSVEDAGGRTIVARPPAGVAECDVLVILYPGGLVRPQAYEWLARTLAADGCLTVIPEFSFDLAVTDAGRAGALVERYGEGRRVVLAGHSLGGAMAAQYAADHAAQLAGLVLLAAYPGDSADLSASGLPVLSLTGEHDQVINAAAQEAAWTRLPADTARATIAGGVHSFFGRYGPQNGDGVPTVSRATAEAQISQAIEGFLGELG